MPDITLVKASLIAIWLETLFYGAYAVLFSICIYILFYKRTAPKVNLTLVLTAITMFSLSTMHVSIGLKRTLEAFINTEGVPGGALEYYANIGSWSSIFKQALYATNNIVGDGLVVYRCYIVWGHNIWICVMPIIMLLATSISGYAAVFEFSQVKPGGNVFAQNIADWGTALFSLSLATNLTVTTLIATRIWWLSQRASSVLGRHHQQRYKAVVAIIIESGAIYSVSLIILLILYVHKLNSQYIVYDSLAQIMGIVPTLIIVRVSLGVSTQDTPYYPPSKVGTMPTFHMTVRRTANGSQGIPEESLEPEIADNFSEDTFQVSMKDPRSDFKTVRVP